MDEYNGFKIEQWPFETIDAMYNAGDHAWMETCEGIFWYCLEVVPPIRMEKNSFMLGECWTHDENGAIYQAVVEITDGDRSRYFTRNAPILTFNPATYTAEIRAQFGITQERK